MVLTPGGEAVQSAEMLAAVTKRITKKYAGGGQQGRGAEVVWSWAAGRRCRAVHAVHGAPPERVRLAHSCTLALHTHLHLRHMPLLAPHAGGSTGTHHLVAAVCQGQTHGRMVLPTQLSHTQVCPTSPFIRT